MPPSAARWRSLDRLVWCLGFMTTLSSFCGEAQGWILHDNGPGFLVVHRNYFRGLRPTIQATVNQHNGHPMRELADLLWGELIDEYEDSGWGVVLWRSPVGTMQEVPGMWAFHELTCNNTAVPPPTCATSGGALTHTTSSRQWIFFVHALVLFIPDDLVYPDDYARSAPLFGYIRRIFAGCIRNESRAYHPHTRVAEIGVCVRDRLLGEGLLSPKAVVVSLADAYTHGQTLASGGLVFLSVIGIELIAFVRVR